MPDSGPQRWPRLPRPTARLRLTVLYGAAFLACGAVVLALTYLLYGGTVHFSRVTVAPVFHHVLKAPASDVHRDGRYDVITIPFSAQQAKAARSDLGQISLARRQLLVASAIALGVFAVAATAIGWLLAGRVLRPPSGTTSRAETSRSAPRPARTVPPCR